MIAMATLAALLFKHARTATDLAERLRTWVCSFDEVVTAPKGLRAVEAVVRYILTVNADTTPEALEQALAGAVGEEAREVVVSTGRNWKQEIFDQGQEQGIERGRQQVVLKQLRLKFGALSDEVVTRVESGRGPDLDRWEERILVATRLEDVFERP